MVRLTATEVARSFSEVLNRIAQGEEIEVTRSGAPVAVITTPRARLVSADRFRELLATAPPVDDDFVEDVRRIRREAGTSPESAWPS
jgi:prevent-host-death family protein